MGKLKTMGIYNGELPDPCGGWTECVTEECRRIKDPIRQKDKKNQEKFKMLMQVKLVKIQLKNYYHMVVNIIIKIKEIKEGEIKWQE